VFVDKSSSKEEQHQNQHIEQKLDHAANDRHEMNCEDYHRHHNSFSVSISPSSSFTVATNMTVSSSSSSECISFSVVSQGQQPDGSVEDKNFDYLDDEDHDDDGIADLLRSNPSQFQILYLWVDDLDEATFEDIRLSFQFNYTLREVTLIRSTKNNDHYNCGDSDGYPQQQESQCRQRHRRTPEELHQMLREVMPLPRIERVGLENFEPMKQAEKNIRDDNIATTTITAEEDGVDESLLFYSLKDILLHHPSTKEEEQ